MNSEAILLLPDEQLVERALNALLGELGPIETSRFLSLARTQRLDSVERHRTWQANLDRKQFFDEVFGTSTD